MSSNADRLICVGKILSPHGIKGQLKIKSFTDDPQTLAEFPSLYDAKKQQTFELTVTGNKKDLLIAWVEGVNNRTDAEKLKGRELFIERSMLPEPEEEEFYYEDLIGLPVFDAANNSVGTVKMMHNFGAGDMMEITGNDGKELLIPFTQKAVPVVDIASRSITLGEAEVVFAKEE